MKRTIVLAALTVFLLLRPVAVSGDVGKPDMVIPVSLYDNRVHVVFSPPAKNGDRHNEMGELIIRTNDPREPFLRVRLVARAQ